MLPQEIAALGRMYDLRQKAKRRRQLVIFLIISVVLQLLFFYGIERFLSRDNGLDVEPSVQTEVREHKVSLSPSPVSPADMAVSADHKLLALVDSDELRIYNLLSGQQINAVPINGERPGVFQWLPDRNRLIFALMGNKSEVVQVPVEQPTGVKDETYSSDTYRQITSYQTVTKEMFNISLYSLDDQADSQPELIQTLKQAGQMPEKINLSMSTYTNLLYVYWTQNQGNCLVQVDIMKRIKDINLPRGELTRLVVSSRSGQMWAEMNTDGSALIYKYQKNRWKLQKQFDGYRLLGVTPDERLAVAPDQAGESKKVYLVDEQEDFKPAWVFSSPINLANASILDDGRLMYLDTDRVIIYTAQLGKGTVFEIPKVDGFSPDRKMLVSWDSGNLNVLEEVVENAKQ